LGGEGGKGVGRGLTILLATDDAELRPEFVKRLERHGTVFFSVGQWALSSCPLALCRQCSWPISFLLPHFWYGALHSHTVLSIRTQAVLCSTLLFCTVLRCTVL